MELLGSELLISLTISTQALHFYCAYRTFYYVCTRSLFAKSIPYRLQLQTVCMQCIYFTLNTSLPSDITVKASSEKSPKPTITVLTHAQTRIPGQQCQQACCSAFSSSSLFSLLPFLFLLPFHFLLPFFSYSPFSFPLPSIHAPFNEDELYEIPF